jgi:hypothetical protein
MEQHDLVVKAGPPGTTDDCARLLRFTVAMTDRRTVASHVAEVLASKPSFDVAAAGSGRPVHP